MPTVSARRRSRMTSGEVRYLKRARSGKAERDQAVEARVRELQAELRDGGDEAVRRLARDLDRWTGEFRVSADPIRQTARDLPETFKDDFAFCKKQVTDFAKLQRDSLHAFEVELTPGTVLGQKLVPVRSVGCYIPGGKYPLISPAIMSVATASVAGVARRRRLCAAARCRRHLPARSTRCTVRRRRDLLHRRRAGDGGDGLRPGRHADGRHDHRPGQRLCRRGQAAAVRHGRHRPPRRSHRDPGDRRRRPPTRARGHRPAGPGRAWARQPGLAYHHLRGLRAGGDRRSTASSKTLPTAEVAGKAWDLGRDRRRGRSRRGGRPQRRLRARASRAADRPQRLLPERLQNYGSLFIGEESTSPTATRASAPTTRCRPAAPRATPAGCGSASSSRP